MKWVFLFTCLCFSGVVYSGDYTLYFVRHFERHAKGTDPTLTEQGHKQAQQLANLLDNVGLEQIYSTDYLRTKQSAEPIAKRLDIEVTQYNPRELTAFAQTLIAKGQTALIVGHSNTTPVLVNLVGGEAEPLTEKDYGDVFIVKFSGETLKAVAQVKVKLVQ